MQPRNKTFFFFPQKRHWKDILMSMKTGNNGWLFVVIRKLTPRLLIVTVVIAFLSLAGAVGTAVYKEIPLEMWGVKVDKSHGERWSGDVPFLMNEVEQLKKQRTLLESRLVKLQKENESQKSMLKDCPIEVP